jgi:D-3-phosphoglycerate dehydrogenase
MRWKVLLSAPYMQPVVEQYRARFTAHGIEVVVPRVNERLEEADLLEHIADIDGVICGDDRFTERVLGSAPKLKVISKWGTGIDSIDREACKRLGIRVCNTPNAFSEPVADSVLGYMLCFARNLLSMTLEMRRGVWHKIPGFALNDLTLGVIGVGDVGKAVIRRARAFGITILGNDIVPVDERFLADHGVRMTTKEELLGASDFVSINCDLNPTSYHIISSQELASMKRSAVLINTARGPLVDEPALVDALETGKIAGAALDVFEFEPLPPTSPLMAMPQVLMAPHNSNSSPRAWLNVHESTIRNLITGLAEVRR